jgi:hypothetical protein
MDESAKLDAFVRGLDPKNGNKTKFNKIIENGGFGAILDAIKNDMNEKESVPKPVEKWGKTDIYKRGD